MARQTNSWFKPRRPRGGGRKRRAEALPWPQQLARALNEGRELKGIGWSEGRAAAQAGVEKPYVDETSSLADVEMSQLLTDFGRLGSHFVEARRPDSPGGRDLSKTERQALLALSCEIMKRISSFITAITRESEAD